MNKTYYLKPTVTLHTVTSLVDPHKPILGLHPNTPGERALRQVVEDIAPLLPPGNYLCAATLLARSINSLRFPTEYATLGASPECIEPTLHTTETTTSAPSTQ
jgi:hypothetical protein